MIKFFFCIKLFILVLNHYFYDKLQNSTNTFSQFNFLSFFPERTKFEVQRPKSYQVNDLSVIESTSHYKGTKGLKLLLLLEILVLMQV